jgi:hypothetical protein
MLKKQFYFQCIRSVLEAIYKVDLNTVNCIVAFMCINRELLYTECLYIFFIILIYYKLNNIMTGQRKVIPSGSSTCKVSL